MRRRNMGSRAVKKAITWAMVLMLSFSAGMSSIGTMTVYAVDNRVEDCDLEQERVDSDAERFNNQESSQDPAAEAALAKAEEAKSAAEEAEKTVEELQKTIDSLDVENKVQAAGKAATETEGAAGAVKEAEDAAAAATEAAVAAKETADQAETKKDEISQTAKDYNNTFTANQQAADAVTAEDLTSVKGENGEADTALSAYVKSQAETAKQKKQEAEANLQEALKGESASDKVLTASGKEKTVTELVKEVDAAAEEAAKAADDAKQAVEQANQNVADAKIKYNAYAMMYGLPLYGETEVTYTYNEEGFKKAGITDAALQAEIQKQLADREAVRAGKEEIEKTSINTLGEEIEKAQEAADAAKGTAEDAVKAADEAVKAADAAGKLLSNAEGTGSADRAKAAAEEAIDAEVKAAEAEKTEAERAVQEAADKKAEAEKKQGEIDAEQDAIIAANQKDKADYEASLKKVKDGIAEQEKAKEAAEDTIDKLEDKGFLNLGISEIDYAKSISKAKVDEWSWSLMRKVKQSDIDKANATIKKYNEAKKAQEAAKSELDAKKAEEAELKDKITAADNAITAANKTKQNAANDADAAQRSYDEASKVLNEKDKAYQDQKAARDHRVEQADQAYEEMLKNGTSDIIDSVKKALSDGSDGINQVEYDKELNAWANTTFEKYDDVTLNWKFWETAAEIAKIYDDAKDTRKWMDEEYNASKVQEIFNYLGITQWAVSTKQREAAMDAIIKAYRENMTEYEKQLAVIHAQDAANSAENSQNTVKAAEVSAEASRAAAKAAEDVINTAVDHIDEAQDTYDAAKKKLDEVKEAARNIKISSTLELQRMYEQIQKAELKVKVTENALKEAVAAKNAAENFKKWAVSLITDQYTRAYAQAEVGADGKKTPLTENLKNYDTSNDNVISRPSKDFICVSKGTSSVKVPYTIYRNYVNLMYQKDYDSKPKGKGISTGSDMDVIYWAVGEDGKLTGDYYTSINELTAGATYFIGYTFKCEKDGYHIDGLMYHYEKDKEEEPSETPSSSPSESPSSSPSESPSSSPSESPSQSPSAVPSTAPSSAPSTAPDTTADNSPEEIVTIEDQEVPLAAVPADAPAVLGARRAAADEDAAVLGVKRGADQAVLGKRRSPKTGDSTAVFAWAGTMAAAGAAAAVAGTKLAKKKEED